MHDNNVHTKHYRTQITQHKLCTFIPRYWHNSGPGQTMGAGTGWAGWASAHPGKNQGGHGPPWKF